MPDSASDEVHEAWIWEAEVEVAPSSVTTGSEAGVVSAVTTRSL